MKRTYILLVSVCLLTTVATFPAQASISVYHPRTVVDPAAVTVTAVQQSLGNEPEALYTYVRDRIRYTPYAGVMQGARGTLLTQTGNALDQSLLLVALLQAAGKQARLMTGNLSLAQTRELLKGVFATHGPSTDSNPPWAQSIAREAKSQLDAIFAAMKADGTKLPLHAQKNEAERLMEQMRTHWWVQWRRNGSWVDLDPSFPGAVAGQARATAARTVGTLPDSIYQKLTLRLKVNEEVGNNKTVRTLMTQTLRTADLMGELIFLTHQSETWKKPGSPKDMAAGTLDALVGGDPDNYVPVLTIAGKDWKGASFYPEGKKGRATGISILTAALSENTLPLTEWVELELTSPLGTVTARYDIFDRTAHDTHKPIRGDLGLNHPAKNFLCFSLSAGPLSHPLAKVDRKSSTVTHAGTAQGSYTDISRVMSTVAYTVNTLTDRLVQHLEDDEAGRAAYTPLSPRIVVLDARQDDKQASFSIDLRHTQYLPLGDTALMKKNRFLLQIVKGVVDGVVENHLIDMLSTPATHDFSVSNQSAVSVFRAARHAGIKPVLLKKPEERSTAPEFSAEANARISADLNAGQWIVMPKRQVSLNGNRVVAWWRIDSTTGHTVGVTENGLHGAFTEYKVMLDRNTLAVRQIWVKHAGTAVWTRMDSAGWAAVLAAQTYLRMRGLLTVHIFSGGP